MKKTKKHQKKNHYFGGYWSQTFGLKAIITKLIMFSIAIVLLIPAAVALNLWAQKSAIKEFDNPFISIEINVNQGIAFSWLENNTMYVYLIQAIVVFCVLIILIFFCKKWYCVLFWSLVFLGGLFNIIDRVCVKKVVCLGDELVKNAAIDYFKFNIKGINFPAIFNIPDVGVCLGAALSVVTGLVELIIYPFKKNKKSNKK